ncbi:hypothetical protein, partial [Agathobacter rectalis]|uniref:hypothetical protein n=1 Tax=Agathobacter rectalis TaxID=39491 RepID=UPI002ED4727C
NRRKALVDAYAAKYDAADIYECPVCIVESENIRHYLAHQLATTTGYKHITVNRSIALVQLFCALLRLPGSYLSGTLS